MDQNDISAILPVEGLPQKHYINNQQLMVKGSVAVQEANEPYAIISSDFPNVYYDKRSMKSLLQQRSLVCQYLKLKLKPANNKKPQMDISVQEMQGIITELFAQCPTVFDPLHFVFIIDCGTAYGFFSGDGKYVPMCKRCNYSSYIVIKICCNPKCKIKLLAQNAIESKQKSIKKTHTKVTKQSSSKIPVQKFDTLKSDYQQKKRVFTKQQLNLIKKTANKITYS